MGWLVWFLVWEADGFSHGLEWMMIISNGCDVVTESCGWWAG
jgi:hypothetical protein